MSWSVHLKGIMQWCLNNSEQSDVFVWERMYNTCSAFIWKHSAMGFAGAMDQGPSIYVGALEQGPRWGIGGRGLAGGALCGAGALEQGPCSCRWGVQQGCRSWGEDIVYIQPYPMKFIIHLFQCSRANEVIILRCIQLFSMHFVFHLFQCSHVGLLQGKI